MNLIYQNALPKIFASVQKPGACFRILDLLDA